MIDAPRLTTTWAPRVLSLLRIIAGLLFLEHGLAKVCDFPHGGFPGAPIPIAGVLGASALIELIGSPFIVLGLFTRPVAFLLSGEMAVAYFLVHAPTGFFPILNHGEEAILYCFIFLYLSVAGAGAWSLDQVLGSRRTVVPATSG
ncbi:MAG: DoxX family protein [Rhodospirillaceae bacterium]|nr:MAG: DoxX family protein [Rhodospirillaceae bacterium]